MAGRIVGDKEFIWLGNWLAIDFINTDPGSEFHSADLIPDAKSLKRWLVEGDVAGATSSLLEGKERDHCWSLALTYRTLLRRGIVALATGRPMPETLIAKTNMLLAEIANADRIVEQNGAYHLVNASSFKTPRTLMIPIARSFAKLLVDADRRRIRECRYPECGLYFYDTSKSGTRVWCSLDLCGNKSRVAAFRRKRAQLARLD